MDITVTEEGNVKVISIDGDLDTNTSPDAQAAFSSLLEQGASKVLVDLGKMNYISSAGLRVMLFVAKQLGTSGGELRICCLNDMAREVFDISGFSSILSVFASKEQAFEDF